MVKPYYGWFKSVTDIETDGAGSVKATVLSDESEIPYHHSCGTGVVSL
jgi:hypothetical protein